MVLLTFAQKRIRDRGEGGFFERYRNGLTLGAVCCCSLNVNTRHSLAAPMKTCSKCLARILDSERSAQCPKEPDPMRRTAHDCRRNMNELEGACDI
jgi:hypothetical protein